MILLYMNRRWQNSQVFVLALLACFCTMVLIVGCKAHRVLGPEYSQVQNSGISCTGVPSGQLFNWPWKHDEPLKCYVFSVDESKLYDIPLLSTKVDDGMIQTKDYGVLQVGDNSLKLFATESQTEKLLELKGWKWGYRAWLQR
jgi:hypothetical protein